MYLDCDTTPPLYGRYTRGNAGLEKAVEQARKLLSRVTEGQVGLYDSARGDGFHGYVIKRAGEEPEFEKAEEE